MSSRYLAAKVTAAILAGMAIALLTGCAASTTLYRDGKRIAHFQGNMSEVIYTDGDTRLSASTVDHSTPTTAQGAARTSWISGLTAGLTALLITVAK